jgi:hypothetical protein
MRLNLLLLLLLLEVFLLKQVLIVLHLHLITCISSSVHGTHECALIHHVLSWHIRVHFTHLSNSLAY